MCFVQSREWLLKNNSCARDRVLSLCFACPRGRSTNTKQTCEYSNCRQSNQDQSCFALNCPFLAQSFTSARSARCSTSLRLRKESMLLGYECPCDTMNAQS